MQTTQQEETSERGKGCWQRPYHVDGTQPQSSFADASGNPEGGHPAGSDCVTFVQAKTSSAMLEAPTTFCLITNVSATLMPQMDFYVQLLDIDPLTLRSSKRCGVENDLVNHGAKMYSTYFTLFYRPAQTNHLLVLLGGSNPWPALWSS